MIHVVLVLDLEADLRGDRAIGELDERRAGDPVDPHLGRRAVVDVEHEQARHQQQQHRVDHRARAKQPLRLAREDVLRRVADQVLGPLELLHHRVAGIDALRTADALHLQALADVDPGRAHGHARAAIDAIPALLRGAAFHHRQPLLEWRARFAALGVVPDDQRLLVEQHGLQPAVRTRHDAGLLAKVRKVEHHQRRHAHDHREPTDVVERRVEHPVGEPVRAHEVGQEHVREPERDRRVDHPLEHALGVDAALRVELVLLCGRALEPALDRAEHELQVDRLRAPPAAPHPAEQRRDQEHGQHDGQPEQHQQEPVARPEHAAEHRKLARDQIEQQRGPAVDPDERERHEHRDQGVPDHATPAQEPAAGEPRVDPVAGAVLVEGRENALGFDGGGHGRLMGW